MAMIRTGSPRHGGLTGRNISATPRIWRAISILCLCGVLYSIFDHRYAIRRHLDLLHAGDASLHGGSPFLAASRKLADRKAAAQWAIGVDPTQEALAGAWKPGRRDPEWVSPSPYRLDSEVMANISRDVDDIDFCRPHAIWPGRPPTIVLRPYSLDATVGQSLDTSARTHSIETPFAVSPDSARLPKSKSKAKDAGGDDEEEEEDAEKNGGEISQIGFLPWAPLGIFSKDDHSDEPVPRFRDGGASSYVNFHNLNDKLKNRIPPPPPSMSPHSSDSPDDPKGTDARTAEDPKGYRYRTAPCLSYDVPASEDTIPKELPPRFMFGMATNPQRILRVLPVWEDWHSSAPTATLPSYKHAPSPPRFLVLAPPRTASGEPTDAIEWDRAYNALQNSSIPLTMRALPAPRNEQRYFSLVREMWKDETERADAFAKSRAKNAKGADEAEPDRDAVAWFILADDDTYFLSLGELGRMVAKYDPDEPRIVGSHSENPMQVVDRIAFGGAGILLSRGMMKLLNKPNFFDMCFSKFGHLGGDGIVSFCAASAMRKPVKKVLTIEPTLHQFDIGGEVQGFFQAGLRIASLHHWNSWYSLFPHHHTTAIHDDYQAVRMVGRAARGVGVSNWGRRYVWGLPEGTPTGDNAVVVLSIGYSLTIWAPGELDHTSLNRVEHTFGGSITLASRPQVREGLLKRTYYLIDCQFLPDRPEVVILRHSNKDGELIDVVWDGRKTEPPPRSATLPPPTKERNAEDVENGKEGDGFRKARYASKPLNGINGSPRPTPRPSVTSRTALKGKETAKADSSKAATAPPGASATSTIVPKETTDSSKPEAGPSSPPKPSRAPPPLPPAAAGATAVATKSPTTSTRTPKTSTSSQTATTPRTATSRAGSIASVRSTAPAVRPRAPATAAATPRTRTVTGASTASAASNRLTAPKKTATPVARVATVKKAASTLSVRSTASASTVSQTRKRTATTTSGPAAEKPDRVDPPGSDKTARDVSSLTSTKPPVRLRTTSATTRTSTAPAKASSKPDAADSVHSVRSTGTVASVKTTASTGNLATPRATIKGRRPKVPPLPTAPSPDTLSARARTASRASSVAPQRTPLVRRNISVESPTIVEPELPKLKLKAPGLSSSTIKAVADGKPPGSTLLVGIPCVVSTTHGGLPFKFRAVVKYLGEAFFEPGQWVGVEVAEKEDLPDKDWNDGSVNGTRYFELGQESKESRLRLSRVLTATPSGERSAPPSEDSSVNSLRPSFASRASRKSDVSESSDPVATRGLFVRPAEVVFVF